MENIFLSFKNKWENFDNTENISFKCEGVLTQNPTITLTPKNYSGKEFAIEETLSSPFAIKNRTAGLTVSFP